MKYIVYREANHRVYNNNILDKAPISVSKGLDVARCEVVPTYNRAKGEYLEVFNIQEHTETYTEKEPREVKKVDELTGEEYTEPEYVEVVKTRPYKTCELVVMVDNKLLKSLRLRQLKSWFDNEYRYYAEKFTRFNALNISDVILDKIFNITYFNLNDLYLQAEKVRTEIKKLEVQE